MDAIKCAPPSHDVTSLKSYLGLLNFYGKFLLLLPSKLKPLYDLLRKNSKFEWTDTCQLAFQRSKDLLLSNQLLVHFDVTKPIIVSCDASPYDVGAVLSHLIKGEERPVLFASSTLSDAEKKYSQLHRKALAIVFAVRKFHRYLYGNKFILFSDHKPLREIFGHNKQTPAVAAARIQRWAIFLGQYSYEIRYKKGTELGHADALSRLPSVEPTGEENYKICSLNVQGCLSDLPIKFSEIISEIKNDKNLIQVIKFIIEGWPNKKYPEEIGLYFKQRNALSCEDGALFYGSRIVVPGTLRRRVLELLHAGHPGIVRSKILARGHLWWPRINQDIEEYIGACSVCQLTQRNCSDKSKIDWQKNILSI